MARDATGKIRAAILASGNGSNAENILRFADRHGDRLTIPLVITDRRDAGVIRRAEKCGVPCAIVAPEEAAAAPDRAAARLRQEDNMLRLLASENIGWLFLAGYMRLLSREFLQHFYDPGAGVNRVVNVHPALLPAFPGRDAYRKAYDAGLPVSGVTLHFVDDGMDTGPVIAQKSFSRTEGMTFEEFRAAGQALEYEMYNAFLQRLIDGSWRQEREKKWAQP